jgi:hypothetical protein
VLSVVVLDTDGIEERGLIRSWFLCRSYLNFSKVLFIKKKQVLELVKLVLVDRHYLEITV